MLRLEVLNSTNRYTRVSDRREESCIEIKYILPATILK